MVGILGGWELEVGDWLRLVTLWVNREGVKGKGVYPRTLNIQHCRALRQKVSK
jgi:hypothetical protein